MTRITFLAVARRTPGWVKSGFEEYNKRLPRELKIGVEEISPSRRGGGRSLDQLLAAEAEAVLARLPGNARAIVLDEKGATHTTMELASMLGGWLQAGTRPCFIIGGADGLHDRVKAAADETWSLSRHTLPHALVRVILAEQIYRAWCVLNGHPYHRE